MLFLPAVILCALHSLRESTTFATQSDARFDHLRGSSLSSQGGESRQKSLRYSETETLNSCSMFVSVSLGALWMQPPPRFLRWLCPSGSRTGFSQRLVEGQAWTCAPCINSTWKGSRVARPSTVPRDFGFLFATASSRRACLVSPAHLPRCRESSLLLIGSAMFHQARATAWGSDFS